MPTIAKRGEKTANSFKVSPKVESATLMFQPGAGLSLRDALPGGFGFPLTPEKWRVIIDRLKLSRRESEIARLTLESISEEAIAAHLMISPSTVHAHIERTYRKLKVHSRQELIIRLFSTFVSTLPFDHRG